MKKTDIEIGNKLIAEFVDRYKGYKITDCEDPIVIETIYDGFSGIERSVKTRPFTYSDLKYHIKWDWLMIAIEKIEKMGWIVIIQKGLCHIFSDKFPKIDVEFANKSNNDEIDKLDLCWLTVLDFIRAQEKNKIKS
jgi:hypothetical protein